MIDNKRHSEKPSANHANHDDQSITEGLFHALTFVAQTITTAKSIMVNSPPDKPKASKIEDSANKRNEEIVKEADKHRNAKSVQTKISFVPRSRGKLDRLVSDKEKSENPTEGPLQRADRLAEKEKSGFDPTRTAKPLDGDRKIPIATKNPDLGHGPQGEYDMDPDNKDRSSIPRNPKDTRSDKQ
jgi:hypothetical protein